jgi:hypothetical protein
MLERFTNKIAYLYNNCRSDIEWLQEVLTPEAVESMDQTCVASIKAITKIKWKIEKLKWKIGETELINQILVKVDEISNSLQTSKDQISELYKNNPNVDLGWLISNLSGDKIVENLENLVNSDK